MIKIDVVWRTVNSHPFYWLSIIIFIILIYGFSYRLKLWTICFNVLVAIPTSRSRWHICMTRILHKRLAVTTIHTQLTYVQLMIVWYWLVRLITNPRILGSEVIRDGSTNPDAQQNEGTNYFYREVVSPTRERIGHL